MRYNIDREGRDSLHEIIFYEDAAGNKPVLEFIQELRSKNGKDARIRLNMLMYGKEASNRKQEIDRQHYTIPNQRPKDKHCGKI